MSERLGERDAVLVVDVQNDFCPGGALAVPEGDRVVGELNAWIERAQREEAVIAASRDAHPAHHISFEERGGPWPRHCVQGTEGAALHEELELPAGAIVVRKGEDPDRDQYSAFDGTGLAERLKGAGVERVWVGGLAEDVCVAATVRDGLEAGFEVHLIKPATRPVEPAEAEALEGELAEAGAIIETESAAAPGPELTTESPSESESGATTDE